MKYMGSCPLKKKKNVAGSSYCKQQMWQAADIAINKCDRQQILLATTHKKLVGVVRMLYSK
jgi:hypothetical protein